MLRCTRCRRKRRLSNLFQSSATQQQQRNACEQFWARRRRRQQIQSFPLTLLPTAFFFRIAIHAMLNAMPPSSSSREDAQHPGVFEARTRHDANPFHSVRSGSAHNVIDEHEFNLNIVSLFLKFCPAACIIDLCTNVYSTRYIVCTCTLPSAFVPHTDERSCARMRPSELY